MVFFKFPSPPLPPLSADFCHFRRQPSFHAKLPTYKVWLRSIDIKKSLNVTCFSIRDRGGAASPPPIGALRGLPRHNWGAHRHHNGHIDILTRVSVTEGLPWPVAYCNLQFFLKKHVSGPFRCPWAPPGAPQGVPSG